MHLHKSFRPNLFHFCGSSFSQDRSSPSPWTDPAAQPHKHKELANYCSLLKEHYHQSYVKGDPCLQCTLIRSNV